MSFFFCSRAQSPKNSQPTIPLVLRGKKKQFRKSTEQNQQSKSHIQKSHIQQRPQTITFPRQRFSEQIGFSMPKPAVSIYWQHPHPSQVEQRIINPRRDTPPKNIKSQIQRKGEDIRRTLDQNLQNIYRTIINQKRYTQNSSINSSSISNIVIPKLQQKLVHEYIQLVYKDYRIQDPLAQRNINITINNNKRFSLPQKSFQYQNRRDSISRVNVNNSNRKAVQLKQSFLIQMFSPSQRYQSKHSQNIQYSHVQSPKKYSYERPSQSINFTVPMQEINQIGQKQIPQIFRYCFICEKHILEVNIEAHQRESCPQFSNLYNMNLREIKIALRKKILRIKSQTQQLHAKVFQTQNQRKMISKLNNLKKQTINYLNNVKNNIKLTNEDVKLSLYSNQRKSQQESVTKNQLKFSFENVMHSYQQGYFKLYENLKKLHWFNLMLKNLELKYEQNYNKNEENSHTRHSRANTSYNIYDNAQNTSNGKNRMQTLYERVQL